MQQVADVDNLQVKVQYQDLPRPIDPVLRDRLQLLQAVVLTVVAQGLLEAPIHLLLEAAAVLLCPVAVVLCRAEAVAVEQLAHLVLQDARSKLILQKGISLGNSSLNKNKNNPYQQPIIKLAVDKLGK